MKTFDVSLTLDLNEVFWGENEDAVVDKILEFITESKFYKNINIVIEERQGEPADE